MTIKVTHQADSSIDTIIIPINGKHLLDSVLPAIEKRFGVKTKFLTSDFERENGEIQCIYSADKRIILIGLGQENHFTANMKAFRQLSQKHQSKLSSKIILSYLFSNESNHQIYDIEAAIQGLVLGTYTIGKFKTNDTKEPHPFLDDHCEIQIECEPELRTVVENAANRAYAIANTQMSVLDLVNAPSNKKTPSHLAEWALNSAHQYGFKARVFDKKQIKSIGLEALLAVNRGSDSPATFIIMEHMGADKDAPITGLVGKGVTFDTGGLSLKPSSNMHFMKSDMGGAAAVFGSLEVAAKLNLPINLVGIVPATDNSIGSTAIKPSDVINSYSGKTIEIIDTDAEGRLILADGIAYMLKHYQPKTLIDLATLTGSAVRTFGYHAAGLFSNDDELAASLLNISDRTGERLWRLPIWDIYKEDLKSDVADIRNYSGKPLAGAIAAAKFLQFFTNEHSSWAHMDIAGVAFSDTEFSNMKSATGYGIRLLTEYFIETSKAKDQIGINSVSSSIIE